MLFLGNLHVNIYQTLVLRVNKILPAQQLLAYVFYKVCSQLLLHIAQYLESDQRIFWNFEV